MGGHAHETKRLAVSAWGRSGSSAVTLQYEIQRHPMCLYRLYSQLQISAVCTARKTFVMPQPTHALDPQD